ncbi:MAG: N-acetylmuramoyl-L-alanine amidase [Ferruginibacter sp.]
MLPLAYYILKVIICSAILFGYYWFFLRNKIFHIYNRFYLLATVVLSLTVPLMRFNLQHTNTAAKTSVIHLLQFVNGGDEYMDEIVIQSHYNHISKEQILMWLFLAVCSFFAFFLIRSVLKIYSLKRNNPAREFDGVNIITTEDRSTPFSFFKDIFWNNAIDINTNSGKRILKHEIAHVQEKHSQDKLFINIVMIMFWCNPIFWLIRKELNIIHEFLADKKAVEDGDTSAFAAMILQTTYPGHHFEIANNFFYSPIKRRLAMLTKNNKTKVNYISRLLVLPLALIVFAAFTLKTKNVVKSLLLKDKMITVVIDAGHGGTDVGATAIDGTKEKDINLDLLNKIKELNQDGNIKLLFTRETDVYQTPKEKSELANKLGADLFISIHVDGEDKNAAYKRSGLSIWVAKDSFNNSESSKLFASALIASFQKDYAIPVFDAPMQRKAGIWVIQESKCPAILIEAGFMTNKKDLAYLKSEDGQTQFAKNVLNAIEKYAVNKNTANDYSSKTITDTTPLKNTAEKNQPDHVKLDGPINVNITGTSEKSDPALFVINGKVYSSNDLKGKLITAKSGEIYEKNNAEMIARYGDKAKDGVFIFNEPIITDGLISGTTITADSVTSNAISDNPKMSLKMVIGSDELKKVLYVVNGKEQQNIDINSISPDKIQSINVIKGKDATSKYGNKAKDGVVEIYLKHKNDTIPEKDNRIFTKVEDEAQFPGGQAAWGNYLRKNLNALTPVDEGWASGTYPIIVQFIVNKDGSISDITILDNTTTKKYPGSKTALECIRMISKGPRWMPAKQNGRIVSAYRRQPITFVVSKE